MAGKDSLSPDFSNISRNGPNELQNSSQHAILFEPQRDKTNEMTCAPSEDSDQPGHPPDHSLCRLHEESLGP